MCKAEVCTVGLYLGIWLPSIHPSIHPWSNLLSSFREYLPQDNIFCIPTTGVRMSRGRVSKSVCQRKAEEMLITKIFNLKCCLRLTCPWHATSAFVSICVKALLKKKFREAAVLLNGPFRKWPAVFCHSVAEECAVLVSLFPLWSNEQSPGLKWLSGVRDRHKEAILYFSWLGTISLWKLRGAEMQENEKLELLNKADSPSCDNPYLANWAKPWPAETEDNRVIDLQKKNMKKCKRKADCV